MAGVDRDVEQVSKKIAKAATELKPFQSLEYDPAVGIVSIITELLIANDATDQLTKLLAARRADEKVTVTRYAENYRVVLIRRLKL